MAPLGPKIASFMGVDREGLKGKYNKLYEFNRKHVCPYFEKAAKDVEAGKCVEAPEGELKKVIERGIQVEESKSRSPVKKRNRTAKRARSSRKPDFFEMLHPGAESSSRSERGSMSSSVSASKSESRSASKSKSESASASKSGRTAKRARKSESPVSAKSREGDDIRKYFSPTKKASKREGADIRSFFSSTKRAKSSTGGKRRTRRRR